MRIFLDAGSHLGSLSTLEKYQAAADAQRNGLGAAGGAELAEKLARGSWLGAIKTMIRMKRDLGVMPNPKVDEEIARMLFQTPMDPASTTARRLTGELPAPPGVNRLGTAADVLGNAGSVISPGAAAALDQRGYPQ